VSKNKYSPLAYLAPRLLALPNPKFSLGSITFTKGKVAFIASTELSEEALSTTMISKSISVV